MHAATFFLPFAGLLITLFVAGACKAAGIADDASERDHAQR